MSAPKATAAEEPAEVTASFIPPDGSGTTFFSLTQRLPGGRYRVADVMVRDDIGVVHATSAFPSTSTVQQPHWPCGLHPSLGDLSP